MLEKINYRKLFTRTNVVIAVFGILPAAGYLIGISFYQGRLAAYGVSSDAFPLALQDIYVEAFWAVGLWLAILAKEITAVFQVLSNPPGLYKLAAAAVIVMLIVYVLIKHQSGLKSFLRNNLQPIKKMIDYLDSEKNAFTKAAGLIGGVSYLLVVGLWLVLVLFLCWVGLPVAAYYKGRDNANITISTYLEKGCFVKEDEKWTNCKRLVASDGKQLYEGILVAHTNGYIAFFNTTGSYVSKFPENAAIVSLLPK
jgi:uncharacterized membrane protein